MVFFYTQDTGGLSLGGDRLSQWETGGTYLPLKAALHPGSCGRDRTPEQTDVRRDTNIKDGINQSQNSFTTS